MGICIDMSKVFDTVDHSLLIKKMQHYGIGGISLWWFSDYINNREQYVSLDNCTSEILPVTCDVPQGFILGPLLFILFINDIVNTSNLTEFIMFADDTILFFKHQNLITLYNIVNTELIQISKWFKLNKLSLNTTKTIILLFFIIKAKLLIM